MKLELTQSEVSVIIDALNLTWHDAVNNLRRKDLGDIERRHYEFTKERTKEIQSNLLKL